MDYYNAVVRNMGDVRYEVSKENISAPEVIIMREIHGFDGVVRIEYSKTIEEGDEEGQYDEGAEIERLNMLYADGLAGIKKPTDVETLFGRGRDLPTYLPEFRRKKEAAAKPLSPKEKKQLDDAVI